MSIYGDGGPGARYGAALANVGDLDQDGFADFAVGSPFENEGKEQSDYIMDEQILKILMLQFKRIWS